MESNTATNTDRLLALGSGGQLWRPNTREGGADPVTVMTLRNGERTGLGFEYHYVAYSGRPTPSKAHAWLGEDSGWINSWDLYDTREEAATAAAGKRSGMSSMEKDVLRYGSH